MTISSSSATTWGTSGVAQTHAAPTCLRSGRPGGPALQGPRGQEGLGRARGGQSTQRARVPSGEEGGVGCLSIAITWLVPKASPPPGSPFQSRPQGPQHHGHTAGGAGKSTWDHGEAIPTTASKHSECAHTGYPAGEQGPHAAHAPRPPVLAWALGSRTWGTQSARAKPQGGEEEARGDTRGWRRRREHGPPQERDPLAEQSPTRPPSISPHSFLKSFTEDPLSEERTQQTQSPPWGGCPQPGGVARRGPGSEGRLLLSEGLDQLAGSGEGLTASGDTGQHLTSHVLQRGQCCGVGKAGGPRAGVCTLVLGLRPW